MTRPIRAILLLIMIFVAASGIPLYADTFDFNFEFDFSKPFSSPKGESIAVETSITMLSPSHPRLEMTITANEKNLPLQFNQTNPLALSLYFQDIRINTLQPKDIIITHGEPTIIQLDLPQDFLDIPNGAYELEINLNIENLQTPISSERISISYYTDATYVEALQSINRNETALALYFPDNDASYLIPITRIIPYTRTPLRSTIDNLAVGPNEALGLFNDSPIPTIQRLSLNRNIANVYLPSDIGIYDEYSASAGMAVGSFVNSLTAINEVQAVQFYFDNRIVPDGFHGRVMNEPIYSTKTPKYYVAYFTNTSRILLTPVDTTDVAIINPSVDDLFNGLKYSSQLLPYSYSLQPTVPEEVKLLSHAIEGTTLKLTLNEAFITSYEEYPNHRRMMIDSILYTLTSLEDITSIEFQVEGFDSSLFEEMPLNQAITPSAYINPEL